MKNIFSIFLVATLLLTTARTPIQASSSAEDDYHLPAEFTITDEITNEDVEAFTFTSMDDITGSSSPITNQMISGGGFEPIVYRSNLQVLQDDPNTIYATNSTINGYDVYGQGFLDGGEALVYRPENGQLKLVRRSRIKSFNSSFKQNYFNKKALKGNYIRAGFDAWNRNTDYYFSVASMDSTGAVSELSDWIKVRKQSNFVNSTKIAELNTYSDVTPDETLLSELDAPKNLKAGEDIKNNCVILSWDEVDSAEGYVVFMSYFPEEEQKGVNIELTDHAVPLKAKDMVIVQKNFYDWSRERYLSPRVYDSNESKISQVFAPTLEGETLRGDDSEYNWRLVKHTEVPKDFTNHGETFMKINLGYGRKTVEFASYNHAGPNGNNGKPNDYYKILERNHTYRIEFWAKTDSDKPMTAQVSFDQFYSKLGKKTFTITNEWKKYVAEYTIPDEENTSKWIGRTILTFTGEDSVCIDSYQMYDTITEPNMWFDADVEAVKASGFTTYRNHTFIKSGVKTHNMDMLCNPTGAFNNSAAGSATLDNYLKVCKKAGVRPWFQIEMHMSPEEWLGWAEFMCATYDPAVDSPKTKPYAYKRYLAGQTKPWIEEFDKILFEISNETWNTMFRPWNFAATVDAVTGDSYNAQQTYGLYQEYVLDLFRYSKYGKQLAEKMESVLGGWATTAHEVNAGKYSPSTTYLTRAAYNGGFDEGTILSNDDEGYFFTSVYGIQKATAAAQRFVKDRKAFGDSRPLGTYEAGPGYPLPSGSLTAEEQAIHTQQNQVQKSLAGAVSTMDCFLLNAAYYDYDIQNYFTFSRGESYFTSHASLKDGGQEHLAFKALTMFNNTATGDFVNVETVSAPTYDIPVIEKRSPVDDAPMVSAYATKNGNKYNVFVLSRKIKDYPFEGDDGYTEVTLNLPFTNVDSVTVQRMIGDPKTTNISAENIKIEKETLNIKTLNYKLKLDETTGAEAKGVGPCSIYLYTFDISDQQPATPIPTAKPTPTPEDPSNMVINPGFETVEFGNEKADISQKYFQGWLEHNLTASINSFVTEGAEGTVQESINGGKLRPYEGKRMLQIDPIGGDNALDAISQNIPCLNGRSYNISFYTNNATQVGLYLYYACVNQWGHTSTCGDSSHNRVYYMTQKNFTATDVGNGWYKMEGTFTCANNCGMKIRIGSNDRTSVICLDNFRVEDTNPATLPTPTPTPEYLLPKPAYGAERPFETQPPELDYFLPKPSTTPTATATITPEVTFPATPNVTASPDVINTPDISSTPNLDKPTSASTFEPTAIPSETPTSTPDIGKKPARVKLKKVRNLTGRKIKVTFKKAKRAKKYQIAVSIKKNFAKKKTKHYTTKKLSYVIKKCKKNKTYFVKVRGFCGKKPNRIYGKYSKVKKVKIIK